MSDVALILIKPDGMHKAIAGEILSHFFCADLKLRGVKLVQVSRPLAEAHYSHLKKEFFFKQIISYLMGDFHGGAPVIALVLAGKDAIKKCRHLAGATNPEQAHPRSIRGKFGRITTQGLYENLVHVSSDEHEATREIKLWFKAGELIKG